MPNKLSCDEIAQRRWTPGKALRPKPSPTRRSPNCVTSSSAAGRFIDFIGNAGLATPLFSNDPFGSFKVLAGQSKAQFADILTTAIEFVGPRQNGIILRASGTGNTQIVPGFGLATYQKGLRVRFMASAALVHDIIEATEERRFRRHHKQLAAHLLTTDALGFVLLSKTGAGLLFGVIDQH